MRTGVAAVAALTVSVVLGPVPARAASRPHHVTLVGAASGYVDVTFPRRFRPHVGAFGDPVRPEGWSTGRYVGVWLERLSWRGTGPGSLGTTRTGGYWMVAFGEPDTGAWQPAGRYRLHLMADGTSVERFAVDGLAKDIVVLARHTDVVRTRLVRRSVTQVPGGGLSTGVDTSASTLVIAVGLVRAEESVARLSLCVAASTMLPCEADPDARRDPALGTIDEIDVGGPPAKVAAAVSVVAMPRTLPDGPHDVAFTAAAVPDSTRLELFTLALN